MTNYEVERKYKGYIILPTLASYGNIWLWKLESSDEDFNDASNTLAEAKEEINYRLSFGYSRRLNKGE
jgi:hypothetical protein